MFNSKRKEMIKCIIESLQKDLKEWDESLNNDGDIYKAVNQTLQLTLKWNDYNTKWDLSSLKMVSNNLYHDEDFVLGFFENWVINKALQKHIKNKQKLKDDELINHFLMKASGMEKL